LRVGAAFIATAAGSPHNPAAVTKRLLITDDEQSIVFALTRYFSQAGYEIDGATELEQAQALLDAREFALVIADLALTKGGKGEEGLELVDFIHQHHPSTRIILLTAFGSAEMEREALRRGADAFLQKPQPLSELAALVEALIGSAESGGNTH
jgi:two-component system response regulator PilR (NtrC family)